jgi:hypothetical protein
MIPKLRLPRFRFSQYRMILPTVMLFTRRSRDANTQLSLINFQLGDLDNTARYDFNT